MFFHFVCHLGHFAHSSVWILSIRLIHQEEKKLSLRRENRTDAAKKSYIRKDKWIPRGNHLEWWHTIVYSPALVLSRLFRFHDVRSFVITVVWSYFWWQSFDISCFALTLRRIEKNSGVAFSRSLTRSTPVIIRLHGICSVVYAMSMKAKHHYKLDAI